jgi:hypothetical protein
MRIVTGEGPRLADTYSPRLDGGSRPSGCRLDGVGPEGVTEAEGLDTT